MRTVTDLFIAAVARKLVDGQDRHLDVSVIPHSGVVVAHGCADMRVESASMGDGLASYATWREEVQSKN